MSSKYDSMNHSKFLLRYHIIFVCKYRKKLLMHLGETIKNMMYDISLSSDFIIEEMKVDKDHIHLLLRSVPKLSPLMIVRKLKQETTNRIWKIEPRYLAKHFWKERTFWTDGYFVSTIGEVSEETIRRYIQNQG